MIVLTFANHKGGTGKTTSAICVSAALGMSGHRVLVIDLDPQCFLTRMLGVSEPIEGTSSLSLYDPQSRLTNEMTRHFSWFDLLPASSKAPRFLRKLSKATDVLWVRESIRKADLDYDVIIIDTAAAVTAYSLSALVAGDLAVIPVAPEYQSVIGGEQSFRTIETVRSRLNPDLEPGRFLLTQVDARKKTHHNFRAYLRDKYGDLVLRSIVRTSASLSHAYEDGSTVFDHSSGSRGAVDYANVTDELITAMNLQSTEPGMTEAGRPQPNVVD